MEGFHSRNSLGARRYERTASEFLTLLTAVTLTCLPATMTRAQRVQLAWTPSPNIVEYGIYRSIHPDSSFTLLETLQHPDTTYEDKNIQWKGHYFYAATAIDRFGNESGFSNIVDTVMNSPTGVENSGARPNEFHLYQNYPNPLKPHILATIIFYSLPRNGHVKLTIFDVNGREVYRLVDEFQRTGRHSIRWDGRNFQGEQVASGVYYYKIEALNSSKFRKMLVLR